jgi:hypothetical protein
MTRVSGVFAGETSQVSGKGRERRRRAAMLLVDLSESQALERRIDHLGLARRSEIAVELVRAGLVAVGPIQALCVPGLTAYLCHGADGRPVALRVTIGSRAWLAPVCGADGVARLHAEHAGLRWTVRVRAGAETAQLALDAVDARGRLTLAASFIGRRQELSGWGLFRNAGGMRAAARLAEPFAQAMEAWDAVQASPVERLAA